MSEAGAPLVLPLPEPVGRKARLGPFPSAREALKFASYAAAGAVVAGVTTPLAWLPFLGAGFVVAAVRPDGRGIDERLTEYVRYRYRSRRPSRDPGTHRARKFRGNVVRVRPGRIVAVIETGGVPVAFLPARDARGLFDGFRGLLRGHDGGLLLQVDGRAVPTTPLGPHPAPGADTPELSAKEGYREMLLLLGRRRRRRVVRVVAWAIGPGPGALLRLEERVQALSGRLLALGLQPERLRDGPLGEAVAEIGWEVEHR
jgi:hypothetical protein